jgi:hypothetical protein
LAFILSNSFSRLFNKQKTHNQQNRSKMLKLTRTENNTDTPHHLPISPHPHHPAQEYADNRKMTQNKKAFQVQVRVRVQSGSGRGWWVQSEGGSDRWPEGRGRRKGDVGCGMWRADRCSG